MSKPGSRNCRGAACCALIRKEYAFKFLIFSLVLLLGASAWGADKPKGSVDPKEPVGSKGSVDPGKSLLGKGKGPITITADSLSADSKAGKAVFQGHVVAKSEDMTMNSDNMVVTYSEQGGVEKIEATGSVRLVRRARVITSGKAEYMKADDKVTFTEDPKIAEGGTLITGTKVIYYMSEDRTAVTNSKVFIERK
jgi:lipopolysaccharide transport protein LptA